VVPPVWPVPPVPPACRLVPVSPACRQALVLLACRPVPVLPVLPGYRQVPVLPACVIKSDWDSTLSLRPDEHPGKGPALRLGLRQIRLLINSMGDRETRGRYRDVLLAYWREHHDLSHILQRDWATLGPKLRGKIHLYVGSTDTYFLNGPSTTSRIS